MTTYYEIPTQPQPQAFQITLVGVLYGFTVKWNVPNESWVIDIADGSDNPILSGVPMVTGADLLEQFDYLNFGFQLVCQTDNNPDAVPTYSNLGSSGHLYAIVP